MSVIAPGGNNDPNGKNEELDNDTINDMVSQQHIDMELMGTEITEKNQTLKESIKAVASKSGEVMDKELTSSEVINPMITADELVNVHVQYVEVIKPTPNHATVDQNLIPRAAAREIIKTEETRPTENTAKWKRIERHNDHSRSITNIGSHQTGVKRAQPEDGRQVENEDRKRSKTSEDNQEKLLTTVEAAVQPRREQ